MKTIPMKLIYEETDELPVKKIMINQLPNFSAVMCTEEVMGIDCDGNKVSGTLIFIHNVKPYNALKIS